MAKIRRIAKTDIKRFVTLYVNGPEGVVGNWAQCESVIGLSIPRDYEGLKELIKAEGGSLLEIPPDAPIEVLEKATKSAKSQADWEKLAKRLQPVIDSIATGETKATAAQAALIKHIMDRAYGRVNTKSDDKKPAAAVLILPTLNTGKETTICPVCGAKAIKEANGTDIPA